MHFWTYVIASSQIGQTDLCWRILSVVLFRHIEQNEWHYTIYILNFKYIYRFRSIFNLSFGIVNKLFILTQYISLGFYDYYIRECGNQNVNFGREASIFNQWVTLMQWKWYNDAENEN